jgi:DNA repair exonuclease SbcCD nuclease subunit
MVANLKIFHIADTHLGFSAYNKLDPESGLNQREIDFYNAFERFVDIAVEKKPDLILHAGDLFDSVRPTNRAISLALDQLIRLSEAKIPIVIIAGNHETPRLRETGSVFRLFEHLDHVYPVYKSRYECIEFPEFDLKIHAVPHCMDAEALQNALEKLVPDSKVKHNIAMLHAAIVGVSVFRSSEFNEQDVASGYLKPEFDYIALGHYHEFCKVDENAYYAGSPERVNFLEAAHKRKGFIEIEIELDTQITDGNGGGDQDEYEVFYPEPVLHELETRPMVDLKPVDCSSMDRFQIGPEIIKRIDEVEPEDKILRLKILNLPMEVYRALDFNQLRKLTAAALYFELQYDVTKDDQDTQVADIRFELLGNEFKSFISNQAIEGLDKIKLTSLGLDYLAAAGADISGEGEELED